MDPPHAGSRRRSREYLLALEEERRKIEVFKRELPLCLQLVIQTIEGMKSEMDGIGSEETVSDHASDPVLEEFMPLKPSLSLSSEEHDHAAATSGVAKKEEAAETPEAKTKRVTPDWLQSMELWSQESQQRSSSSLALKAGGAFQPFDKEKQRAELPASSTTAVDCGDSCDRAASTDDTAGRHSCDKEMNAKDKGKDKAANRKPRRCWAPELHGRFLQALQQLGGAHVATPKQIRELMKVDGLTNDEVKSHLQKYRLHTARRPNTTTTQSISASTVPLAAPQFVVVGGIWLPPPEYAAAAAAAAQPSVQLTGDASGMANTVYAPVATLPSGLQPRSLQQGQRQSSECLNGQCRGDSSTTESPAVSSSSHTTSA